MTVRVANTAARRVEPKALPQSSEHYRDLVENSLDLMCTHDLEGVLLTVNQAAARALGYEPGELVNRNLRELLSPTVRGELDAYLALITKRGTASGLMRLQSSSGDTRIWKYTNTLRIEHGQVPVVRGVAHDVTELWKTQRALQETAERLTTAAEIGRMYAWAWDPATDIVRRSAECAGILGANDATGPGTAKDYFNSIHPDDRAGLWNLAMSRTPADPVYRTVYRRFRSDGVLLWLEESGRATFDQAGKMVRLAGMTADITERKQTEEKLRASDERFRLAAQAGKMYAYEWDVATDMLVRSSEYGGVVGLSESRSVPRREVLERIHPDDLPKFREACAELSPAHPMREATYRMQLSPGSVVWVKNSGHAFFDEEGAMTKMIGMITDVTDHKLTEERLREYERAVEGVEEMIVVVDREYRYLLANRKFLSMRKLTKEQVVGRLVREVMHPGVFEAVVKEKLEECFGGRIVRYEMKYSYPEMGERDLLISYFPVEGNNGIDRAACIFRDITERKRAEAAQRESEERFRLMANGAPVMIWMSGTEKVPTYYNQTWLDFTGRSLQDELRLGLATVTHPDDFEQCRRVYNEAFDSRRPFRKECRLRRHDGEYRWVLDTGVPRFLADGSFAGYIGSCMDITDHKLAQEALSNVNRQLIEAHEEERAWIARELHDDAMQRLALLAVQLEQLQQNLPSSSTDEVHNRLQEAWERASDLAGTIRAMSHRLHTSKLEYLGIVAAATGFCRELSEQQRVQIDFDHADVPEELPREISFCLFRVLQEALQNAIKSSGVRHFKVELRGSQDEIQLVVSDSGRGFDPDAATKTHGLGLVGMRERLHLVKGEIFIDSQPNRGTSIRARVPLTATSQIASAVVR